MEPEPERELYLRSLVADLERLGLIEEYINSNGEICVRLVHGAALEQFDDFITRNR